MDLKEIRQIVELMKEHELSLFHLEKKDFNIKLKKGSDVESLRELLTRLPAAPVQPLVAPQAGDQPNAAPAPNSEPVDDGSYVTAPVVGTFYRKSNPDEQEFVKVGDKISEGQVLCIIEAMKVMNEIKAERSGTVAEVCVEDSTPVQFGDVLFRLA